MVRKTRYSVRVLLAFIRQQYVRDELKGLGHVTVNKSGISRIFFVAHTWPLCSAQILVDRVNPQ